MIKWFCDICQQEIEDPLNPEYINIHCEGRNRDEEGWGHSNEMAKLCCHESCAKKLRIDLLEVIRNHQKGNQ